jgi:hypothetical protein
MADWMTVRVELVSGRGMDLDPPPGRVSSSARPTPSATWPTRSICIWRAGTSVICTFSGSKADERSVTRIPSSPTGLTTNGTVSSELSKGDEFEYVFDFGDDWTHHCRVEEVGIDPAEVFGEEPALPIPLVVEGQTEVTYWIDRAVWGRGIASRALSLFLEVVRSRPLLCPGCERQHRLTPGAEKTGFRIIGTEMSFAPARGAEIEETILQLG